MKRADPGRALARALKSVYPGLEIVESHARPWASVTFTGTRHRLRCRGVMPAGIEDAEFSLPGHIVADITARAEGEWITIEGLTIEDA